MIAPKSRNRVEMEKVGNSMICELLRLYSTRKMPSRPNFFISSVQKVILKFVNFLWKLKRSEKTLKKVFESFLFWFNKSHFSKFQQKSDKILILICITGSLQKEIQPTSCHLKKVFDIFLSSLFSKKFGAEIKNLYFFNPIYHFIFYWQFPLMGLVITPLKTNLFLNFWTIYSQWEIVAWYSFCLAIQGSAAQI